MKQPERPPHLQLNLSLLNAYATVVPDGKQGELILALVELLISATGDIADLQANRGEE
jgi:hypothetical protein